MQSMKKMHEHLSEKATEPGRRKKEAKKKPLNK